MKIIFFGVREEEKALIKSGTENYGYEYAIRCDYLSKENINCTKGFDAVNIVVNCIIDQTIVAKLAENGVRYIITRAAGTNHLDLNAIARYGIKTANVPSYSPNAIAEHTVMLALAAIRKFKRQIMQNQIKDFRIKGLMGMEMRNMTVGIVGTGRIGECTAKLLSGFGAKLLFYDQYRKKELQDIGNYVELEKLFNKCDILIFHCPLTKENYHMIDKKSLEKCKNGIILVNCARGGIIDTEAVLEALERGHVGSFAFDVYEKEEAFIRQNKQNQMIEDSVFTKLLSMDNVIYTAHTAFYTDEAVFNMVYTSIEDIYMYENTGNCVNEIRTMREHKRSIG